MSAPPKQVPENQLAFFFQTNEPIPARALLNFLYEVDRIARTQRHLGPAAVVEILEIQTGTKLARLSIEAKIALVTLGVAVVALGNDLSQRIQSGKGRLAESVAQMCIENGVVECVITTNETQIRIGRDQMPAIDRLENRGSQQLGYGNRYGFGYGGSQGGTPSIDGPNRDERRRIRQLGDALPADGSVPTSRAMDLAGQFIKVAGQNAVVFETGENVFDVSLTGASLREVPLDEDVIARCTFDWADASTVYVHSWRLVEPR